MTASASAAGKEPAARETAGRGLLVVSVMLATIMQVIDTTIANVALPEMQGSLSATRDQISWVLTSYIVAAAIMTPPTGWLADRLGRRRLFLICIAGFTTASVLCGFAGSIGSMVAFRILQGIFGAALVPLSQSTLLNAYPPEKHGQAMALWGVGIMVGPILGPTVGGYLTEYYSWHWVFFINVPVGILAFLGVAASVPDSAPSDRPFDFAGFAFLSLAVGSFQMMLDRGESQDWFASTEIMVEAGLAFACFWMFLVHARSAKTPFVDLSLFKDRNFASGSVFIFIVGIVLLATLALLPPFLQQLMGYPVMTTGLVLAPRGVGTMISMIVVGRILGKVDARLPILAGLMLTALSLHQMAGFTMEVSIHDIVVSGLIQGAGLGLIFVPLSTMTFATLPARARTEAAGLFSLIRNIGSSVGISIVMSLLSRNGTINHATLTEHVTPFNEMLQRPWLPDAWSLDAPAGLAALNAEITRQATQIAFLNDFKLMMLVVLAAAPLLLLLRSPKHPASLPATAADH